MEGNEETFAGSTVTYISNRGRYTVTVTDAAGNIITKSITLVSKPEINTTPAIANGGSSNKDVTISVNGGDDSAVLTVNGTEAEGNTFNAAENGTYTAIVSDKYGYTSESLTFSIDKSLKNGPVITVDTTDYVNQDTGVNVTVSYEENTENRFYQIGDSEPVSVTENEVTFKVTENTTGNGDFSNK